jgi:signal transduction histidine kinase
VGTPLGKKIVSLKIWRKDGRVLFSSGDATVGKTFPIDEGLADALEGHIFSEISERSDSEQNQHGQPLPRLIETYTPIHADGTGHVIAAAEFYEVPDEVDREAGAAQRRSWLWVAGTMLALYVGLFLVVRRGSHTITAQQRELGDKLQQVTALNDQNRRLKERVARAAERAASFNENFLQRVSADLHDGPVQDMGFALMQLKNMGEAQRASPLSVPTEEARSLEQARLAVESALKDVRALSANIELPDIAALCPEGIAERVIRDFQVKTGVAVKLVAVNADGEAAFRVKVALYRLLQESLANTVRHAQGQGCRVALTGQDGQLTVEVSDTGPGFDPAEAARKGRLGLHGMRQRVEVMGGLFQLHTAPGQGTLIRVTLPLTAKEETPNHE